MFWTILIGFVAFGGIMSAISGGGKKQQQKGKKRQQNTNRQRDGEFYPYDGFDRYDDFSEEEIEWDYLQRLEEEQDEEDYYLQEMYDDDDD